MGWIEAEPDPLAIELSTLRKHCRTPDTDDDDLLLLYASAAAEAITRDSRLAVSPRTLTRTIAVTSSESSIALPRGPFLEVVELVAIAADDTETAIDADDYEHDGGLPGRLEVCNGSGVKSLRVSYRAGFETLTPTLSLLIYQLAAHFYEHREAATGDAAPREIPLGYRHAIAALDPMNDAIR